MCGIFALLNIDSNTVFDSKTQIVVDKMEFIKFHFMKGVQRGPESSKLEKYDESNLIFGFHRLAINGLNNESNQPLSTQGITLICNGEIYNYKHLYDSMNVKNTISQSDCEVIIHLYLKYGIDQTLIMLDGVFAFMLFDNRDTNNKKLYIARDPYGVRPLYYLFNRNDNYRLFNLYGFASELKSLVSIYNCSTYHYQIEQFEPGTYSSFILNKGLWEPSIKNERYFITRFSNSFLPNNDCVFDIMHEMYCDVGRYFESAVTKRCITTERPVACLLSGGLDSSLVAALVNDYYKKNSKNNKLETYSIGLEGSEDLRYARIVANYLETDHHEIIVTEDEMFDAIPEVIEAIESYDTTTVRASIGNYLLGKYIKKHSKAKVIFNGDGSDELFGGYLYMNKCPDDIEFDKETRRLLKDIHLFDVLRSDKCISSHGLEPRTPFLDRTFTNYVLSMPIHYRNHNNGIISLYGSQANLEKILLRRCFSFGMFSDWQKRQILPDEILWRKKEAFSDGVSSKGRSLFTILQEKIAENLNVEQDICNFSYEANIDTEKKYYKQLFDKFYPNCEHILPYYWMPKYTDATDPSARTLSDYTESKS